MPLLLRRPGRIRKVGARHDELDAIDGVRGGWGDAGEHPHRVTPGELYRQLQFIDRQLDCTMKYSHFSLNRKQYVPTVRRHLRVA